SEGQVVGFFVAVLLYRDSIALIEDIEPDAVRLHLPEEYDHFARLSADEADTYLAVMVAAEENHPEYRGGELMGVIIRDGLARLGDGTRAILRTNRSDLEELLRMLGFTRYYPPNPRRQKRILAGPGSSWICATGASGLGSCRSWKRWRANRRRRGRCASLRWTTCARF